MVWIVAGILFPRISNSQVKITAITTTARYLPAAGYVAPPDSIKRPGKTTQTEISLLANVSLAQKIDTSTGRVRLWTGSFGALYTSLHNKKYEVPLLPSSLLGGYAGVQHYRTLTSKWGLSVFTTAGIYSDLEKIDGNDLFVNAGAIAIRHFNRHLYLGIGLVVNNNFGSPLLWPALTISWQSRGRFGLDIRVPDTGPGLAYKIGVQYRVKPDLSVEFAFKPGVMTYDVERQATAGKRLMNYWQLPLGVDAKWEHKKIKIIGGAGIMALRSYSFGEKKLSKMFSKYPYYGIGSQFFIQTGIQWRF